MGRLLVIGCALLAALSLAASSGASPGLRVGIQDDAWLQFGPGAVEERAERLRELGADLVRVTLDWRATEPARGELDWERADEVLGALRVAGLTPLVTLYGTPAWANGGKAANVPPRSAADVRDVRARGRRALPVRAALGRLERAEPAPLALIRRRRRSTSRGC